MNWVETNGTTIQADGEGGQMDGGPYLERMVKEDFPERDPGAKTWERSKAGLR